MADKVRGNDLFLRYKLEEKIERVGVDKAPVDVDVRDLPSRCRIGEVLSTPSAIWDARSAGVERSIVNPCSSQRNGGRPELKRIPGQPKGVRALILRTPPTVKTDFPPPLSLFLGVKRNESSRL